MTCWLCDRMVHTKCAGFNGRTSDDLAKVINSFGVARDSFRRADDLLSALNSQFIGLRLLDESPKRKKAPGGRPPKAPQPRVNDQQDSTTDQLSIVANPHTLLRSATKKDSEQSNQSAVEGPRPVKIPNCLHCFSTCDSTSPD